MTDKNHSKNCASHTHLYSGDQRNVPCYADVMKPCDCDGYHTFDELYEHRIVLFIALCKIYEDNVSPSKWYTAEGRHPLVWKSKLHSDGSAYTGWFIMGIDIREGKQITYHLPNKYWDDTRFATVLEHAPEFDGHTPEDVLQRISNL